MKKFNGVERTNNNFFFFLDFDGTISRIVDRPDKAVIMPGAKKWLKKVLKNKNFKVAVVTGRAVDDVHKKIGLDGIYYVGDHGMEIFYNQRRLLSKGSKFKIPLKKFGVQLENALCKIRNVFVERKSVSVAAHFRRVKRTERESVSNIFFELASPFIQKYGLQITKGKMLLELRPSQHWNKGSAVMWLWGKMPGYYPIYIGDDATDEDAFAAVRPFGVTIRIGKKNNSRAEYYTDSVVKMLNQIG